MGQTFQCKCQQGLLCYLYLGTADRGETGRCSEISNFFDLDIICHKFLNLERRPGLDKAEMPRIPPK